MASSSRRSFVEIQSLVIEIKISAICLLIWAHTNSVDQVKEAALDAVVRNGRKICFQDEQCTCMSFHEKILKLSKIILF
jgi:hypothetical protein